MKDYLTRFMRGVSCKLRHVASEQSGSVVIIFAASLVALALIVTGAIEYTRRNRAMAVVQNAVDAAVLSAKRQEVLAKKTLGAAAARTKAEKTGKDTFDNIIKKSNYFTTLTPTVAFTWEKSGALSGSSQTTFNMFFGSILPSNFSNVAGNARVDFQTSTPTEVALVLDTTMSMFAKDSRPESRFTLMRNASKTFTHTLFNAAQAAGDVNLVRVSVVPWATTVNVLGSAPAAADFSGDAPVNSMPDYGSQIPISSPLSRAGLVAVNSADFQPVPWRGCINGSTEGAAYNDGAVASFKALNVSPSPPRLVEFKEGALTPTPVTTCTCTSSVNVPCSPVPGTQGFHQLLERAVPQISHTALLLDRTLGKESQPKIERAQCTSCVTQSCTTVTENKPDCSSSVAVKVPYCNYYTNNGRINSYISTAFACTDLWDSCFENGMMKTADKVAQPCVGDYNEPGYINRSITACPVIGTAGVWDSPKPIIGPNLNCPMPMLGLSGNRKQVLQYLDYMSPVPGGTHADVGLRWALRTLSPNNNWPGFFGLTRKPTNFGSQAQKVMVLVTDGENEQAGDFPGYWGCNVQDAQHPGCVGSPDLTELDNKMYKWCDVIRTTYNVAIYAVAVNFANTAAVDKLRTCVGDPSRVFSVDAADLTNVLDGIAARVMSLRLTQ